MLKRLMEVASYIFSVLKKLVNSKEPKMAAPSTPTGLAFNTYSSPFSNLLYVEWSASAILLFSSSLLFC